MKGYTKNGIFTYVVGKLQEKFEDINCTSVEDLAPSTFPTVYCREINKSQTRENITLAFDDSQYRSTFEVQVFTNKTTGAITEADKIMAVVEDAFRQLYFVETYCQPIPNTDQSIYRLVARFQKHVCGGDTMPETTVVTRKKSK